MKIIFLHHSVGANLIKEGSIRSLLAKIIPEVEFWDHSYNLLLHHLPFAHHTGLTDNQGRLTGQDFNIPDDNTDPDGLAGIFSQTLGDNQNALSKLMNYDLIILKSCYPNTRITSEIELKKQQLNYSKLKSFIKNHPEKNFIILTSPPLKKDLTSSDYAARARKIADWLSSQEFKSLKNLLVFDLFNFLADQSSNFLKKEYCRPFPWDSHPNKRANQEVGSKFVDFLVKSLKK